MTSSSCFAFTGPAAAGFMTLMKRQSWAENCAAVHAQRTCETSFLLAITISKYAQNTEEHESNSHESPSPAPPMCPRHFALQEYNSNCHDPRLPCFHTADGVRFNTPAIRTSTTIHFSRKVDTRVSLDFALLSSICRY